MSKAFAFVAGACAILVAVPAAAQGANPQARNKAVAECRAQMAQLGRGVSPDARRQEMQACVKGKMRKR